MFPLFPTASIPFRRTKWDNVRMKIVRVQRTRLRMGAPIRIVIAPVASLIRAVNPTDCVKFNKALHSGVPLSGRNT